MYVSASCSLGLGAQGLGFRCLGFRAWGLEGLGLVECKLQKDDLTRLGRVQTVRKEDAGRMPGA